MTLPLLMAMTVVRTETNYHTMAFCSQMQKLALTKTDNLDSVKDKMSRLSFGTTDCAGADAVCLEKENWRLIPLSFTRTMRHGLVELNLSMPSHGTVTKWVLMLS